MAKDSQTRRGAMGSLMGSMAVPCIASAQTMRDQGSGGIKYPSASSVPEHLVDVIFDVLNARSFGAIGDGNTNDTASLKEWLAEMKRTGRPGRLGAIGGKTRYLVTPGELEWTFTNDGMIGSAGFAGPKIFVSGNVTLVSDGTADAPFLSIHNDSDYDVNVQATAFVEGGFVEGLTFEDTSVGGSTNHRFGIELYGVNSMRFGPMMSTSGLRGDLIHISPQGNSVTADRWHVWNCRFEGATLINAPYYAFNNNSISQVFNYNHISQLWALGARGAFKGVGAANRIDGISVGWCTGIGVDLVAAPGTTQFCHIGFIECDSSRFGIRIAGIQHAQIDGLRVIYRNGSNPAHAAMGIPDGVTWPELAIEFTDLAGGQVVSDFQMEVFHRFSDIEYADLPAKVISYGGVPSHRRISVTHRTASLFALPSSLFRHDINPHTRGIRIELNDGTLSDTRNVNLLIARCTERSGGTNYDGTTPVDFQSIQVDQSGAWDAANKQWVCPAAGVYALRAKFLVSPVTKDLVRVGLFLNEQKAPFRETQMRTRDGLSSSNLVAIEVSGHYPFAAGDTVKVELWETSNSQLDAGNAGIEGNNFLEIVLVSA